jgi:hypothetical protein
MSLQQSIKGISSAPPLVPAPHRKAPPSPTQDRPTKRAKHEDGPGESASVSSRKASTRASSETLLAKLKTTYTRPSSVDSDDNIVNLSSSPSVSSSSSIDVAGPSTSKQQFGCDISNTPPHRHIQACSSTSRPFPPIRAIDLSGVLDLDDDDEPSNAIIAKALRKRFY